jgi:hypothetical protein
MTVGDLLAALRRLPWDAELLALRAGCEQECEREVDQVSAYTFTCGLAYGLTCRSARRFQPSS